MIEVKDRQIAIKSRKLFDFIRKVCRKIGRIHLERKERMAATDTCGDESLYPIAVLIDELRNEDVQVRSKVTTLVHWASGSVVYSKLEQ